MNGQDVVSHRLQNPPLFLESGFIAAAEYGQEEIMQRIIASISTDCSSRLQLSMAGDFLAFRLSASNGHLNAMCLVHDNLVASVQDEEETATPLIIKMIRSNSFEAFRLAAHRGHIDTIVKQLFLYCETLLVVAHHDNDDDPSVKLAAEMVASDTTHSTFKTACVFGDVELVGLLLQQSSSSSSSSQSTSYCSCSLILESMAGQYAFRMACSNGHGEVVRRIIWHIKSSSSILSYSSLLLLSLIMDGGSYSPFILAATHGHLSIIKDLVGVVQEEESPGEQLQEMVKQSSFLHDMFTSDKYAALIGASGNGHYPVVEYLISSINMSTTTTTTTSSSSSTTSTDLQSALNQAYSVALSNSHTRVARFIYSVCDGSDSRKNMVKTAIVSSSSNNNNTTISLFSALSISASAVYTAVTSSIFDNAGHHGESPRISDTIEGVASGLHSSATTQSTRIWNYSIFGGKRTMERGGDE